MFGTLAEFDWSTFDFKVSWSAKARASDASHLDASYYQCQLVGDDEESEFGEAVDDDDDKGKCL